MKTSFKLLTIISLVALSNIKIFTTNYTKQSELILTPKPIEIFIPCDNSYDSLYEVCIEYLKDKEGFLDTIDYRLDGLPKIGYGHVVRKGDSFIIPLSREVGDRLMRKDFDYNIEMVMKLTDGKLNKPLRGNKLLAMALFSYNCGIGNFMASIFPLIRERQDIKGKLYLFIHYGKPDPLTGKKKQSTGILKRRVWEYDLYIEKK